MKAERVQPDNDFMHLTDWRMPDGRTIRYALRVFCSECTKNEAVAVPSGMRSCNQSHAEKVMRNKGWFVGRNRKHDICPDCQHRTAELREQRRAARVAADKVPTISEVFKPKECNMAKDNVITLKSLSELDPSKIVSSNVALVQPVEAPPVLTPRTGTNMTREDRRIIFTKLNEVYADEKTGYREDWSDRKVAFDLSVPLVWVQEVRDENFGPEQGSEVIQKLIAQARALSVEMMEEHRRLTTEMTKFIQTQDLVLTTLHNRAAKIEKDIEALEMAK